LQDFFYDGWKHKRIDAELEKMMRVSAKRAIAGQKGGIGSALARMKLENSARSRPAPSKPALSKPALSSSALYPAIAAQPSGHAAAAVDHSHSHSHQNLSGGEGSAAAKPALAVSPELAAYLAKRTT
jgi:hypothetical protein